MLPTNLRMAFRVAAASVAAASAAVGAKKYDANLSERINSARSRLGGEFNVADVGTGGSDVRKYGFNFDTGLISCRLLKQEETEGGELSKDRRKIEVKRKDKKPEDFAALVNKIMTGNGCINITSWGRTAAKGVREALAANNIAEAEKLAKTTDYLTVKALESLRNPGLTVEVLPQRKEAFFPVTSLQHFLMFKDPNNKLLEDVTSETLFQIEFGAGSGQSDLIAPTQENGEIGGNWIDKELKSGKDPVAVKEAFKVKWRPNLNPPEVVKGKKYIAIQGLLGIGLSNDAVVKLLGCEKKAWITGEIPVEMTKVIEAMEPNLIDAPTVAAAAILEAVQEKYGSGFKILNVKENRKLFNPEDGSSLGDDKVCHSHGAAINHFEPIKQEVGYDALMKERSTWLKVTKALKLRDLLKMKVS